MDTDVVSITKMKMDPSLNPNTWIVNIHDNFDLYIVKYSNNIIRALECNKGQASAKNALRPSGINLSSDNTMSSANAEKFLRQYCAIDADTMTIDKINSGINKSNNNELNESFVNFCHRLINF